MSIIRTIQCDVCGKALEEDKPGHGWPGWGALQGISLDGVPDPSLCPFDKGKVADFIDKLKQEEAK